MQRQNLTQKHDSIIYFTNEKLFRTLTFFIEINKLQFVMFYYKQINYVLEEKKYQLNKLKSLRSYTCMHVKVINIIIMERKHIILIPIH